MAKNDKNFTTLSILAMPDGKHADRGKGKAQGLYLWVRGNSRIWQHRFTRHGKAATVSLGSVAQVSLAEARAKVEANRAKLAQGIDPARATEAPEPKPASTVKQDTLAYYDHHCREWDQQHATLWLQSMERHVFPAIGKRDTASLTVQDVVDVLKPIWETKHETALRLHGRLRAVIEHAADIDDHGRFQNGNPADRALKRLPLGVAQESVPHQALPWEQAPALYARLAGMDDRRAHALRLLLLTCTPRTAEVVKAQWSEIDLSDGPLGDVWHVPAGRMKGGRARDIPLSHPALDLLMAIRPADWTPDTYIFRANRRGRTVDAEFIPFEGHMQDEMA